MTKIVLFSLFFLFSCINVNAQSSKVCFNGIYYFLNDKDRTATVTCEEDYRGKYMDLDMFYLDKQKFYSGDIVIPGSISDNGKDYNVTDIDGFAFSGCSDMSSITIPNSVIKVGTEMYQGSFSGCTGLKTITIPASVYYISDFAFGGCTNLTDIFLYANCGFTSVVINTGACVTLHVIDKKIEYYKTELDVSGSFSKAIKEIVPIEKVTDFNLTYYVDGAEHKTVQYKYDDAITPEAYPVKEGYTFSGWKDLPSNMPGKNITIYGTFAKNEVKQGSVIYWAKNENAVVTGNDNATGEINILSSVEFNNKQLPVTEIGDNSFKGRSDISKINIPATITKIGERAFANIDHLADVTIYAKNVPETDRTAFENSYIEDYVTLHVPAGSVEKYKAVAPWKNFKSVVAIAGTQKLPAPTVSFENGVLTFACGVEDVKYNWTISSGGAQPSSTGSDKLSFPNVTSYVLSVYATKEGYVNSETTTVSIHIDRADVNRDGKVDVSDHVELTKVIMSYDGSETENNSVIEPYDDPTDL